MCRKGTELGSRKAWVLIAAGPWANHFLLWVWASWFVNKAAAFSTILLFYDVGFFLTEGLKIHGDVCLKSNCWTLYFQPTKLSTQGDRGRKSNRWAGGRRQFPAIYSPHPAFLTCYSNQTNLQLKMRNPSPRTHSTSKLKTFYRLVNLQLRWCSKEQLWSNFDNDENNNHMARFRALLLQLQCSWIDKSD